jgi:hypothetical protein
MSFNETSNVLSSLISTKNLQDRFFEYVYKKIARDTKNRFVEINENSIDIILSDHPSIKVIPLYKNMDKSELLIEKEIERACDIIENSDFHYVYFVYPKNKSFDKHIQVKIPKLEEACSEYMIKLIPYSLNKIQRKRIC